MPFGVDQCKEKDNLWWEVLGGSEDYKLLRIEKGIPYEELQKQGYDIGPHGLGPLIIWIDPEW